MSPPGAISRKASGATAAVLRKPVAIGEFREYIYAITDRIGDSVRRRWALGTGEEVALTIPGMRKFA
jgi:hypothetical protein